MATPWRTSTISTQLGDGCLTLWVSPFFAYSISAAHGSACGVYLQTRGRHRVGVRGVSSPGSSSVGGEAAVPPHYGYCRRDVVGPVRHLTESVPVPRFSPCGVHDKGGGGGAYPLRSFVVLESFGF
ncbi:hypothetical protein, unlikely [Trypanosoma brucei gambiense DAL972]|uniref:Uncharacterized protein n=1 Tax=Trypanosoma brucei gambiense (strain MHOM/CI/86/DAL972) TaxID=679716 RepID=C9ZUF1_TRYB9|nr:hypothetical protein, unlikely [Trypanosoma brucei gambiense DAL972]CBH13038.1 hypothetical protein, unlikely [Trypanosoma brucei gambiense DAL972]|eukprot:XP_011775316.1 hypothetical protein, unlikely [Trypanosoma brucei gambiense DAL972]